MNKKISTLLAAFLAAGFSYTVEAGVVKVTSPATNTKYVIAQDGFVVGGSQLLLQATGASTMAGTDASTLSPIPANALWTVSTAGNSFTLTSSGQPGYITQAANATVAGFAVAQTNEVTFDYSTGALKSSDGTNPFFSLVATPVFASSVGSNASLYTVTEAALAESTVGTYITINDKYLVNDKGTAKLVNAAEYAIAGYTDVEAKWTVSAEGVVANGDKAIGSIAVSGADYIVTLVVKASGVALEKDKYNTTSTALYMGTAAVTNADITKIEEVTNAPVPVAADGTTNRVAFKAGSPFMLHVNGQNGFVSKAENGVIAATNQAQAGNDFYWTATEVEPDVYTFTNNTGEQINLNGIYKFKVVNAGTNLFYLVTTDGANAIELSTSTLALGTGTGSAAVFSFHKIASTDYKAGQLVKKLGDGFNLSIKSKKGDDGVSNFKFNPFKGKLTPVYAVNAAGATITTFDGTTNNTVAKFVAYKDDATASSFMLECADGIIVLDKGDSYPIEGISEFANGGGGYKFKVYSKDDMKALLNATTGNAATVKSNTVYNFSISYPNSSDLSEIELIKIGDYRVISYGNDSEYYLSAGRNTGVVVGTPVYATFDGNAMVKSTDEENNPLLLGYVNLVFQSHNVKVNGNALAMAHNAVGKVVISPVEISNVVLSKPEAQWAVTANDKDVNEFTFTNRESLESVKIKNMYYMGGNKYAVAYSTINPFGYSDVARDTLVIAGAEVAHGLQMDGYANLTALNVLDNQYRLAVASTSNTDFFVTENHSGKHLLGLDKDEDAAATWKLVPLTSAREFNSFGDIKTATDSIYKVNKVGYYNAQGQYKEYTDTLAIISYALQNAKNGEYLTYQNPQTLMNLSMVCDPNSTNYSTSKDLSAAYRFVLKEKQNGLYNLVGVAKKDGATSASAEFVMDPAHKLFGATTAESGAVEVKAMYKDINSNDLFDLQLVAAPEYRLLDRGDTIRIFRQENDYDVMFEKGEFLNIGNKAQLTTMAPALYVDTAYVKRGHNNRYQYLLVVNPTYVPELPCDIDGHPAVHPDTTYGRFLVNLVDTANVAYRKGAIHTNKYINEGEAGENFAKLGFVYGFRTGDKLYITDKNYTKSGKASDVIDLSTNNFNVAKFAFQYINPINHESDGSFKVQTGYYDYNSYIAKNEQPKVSNDGYLKNINGVVVVAKGYEAGDKFDLATEHSNPTANDAISASEVSVVATDGAVIIKGAEGKNVVITNVLGQTIANTAISSSEATIAAPAGVVVVAVEGEAAVKAIVK